MVRFVQRGTHDWSKYINERELESFFRAQDGWGGYAGSKSQGCMYVPAIGWRMAPGGTIGETIFLVCVEIQSDGDSDT